MLRKFDTVPEIELFLNPLINGDFSGDDMLVLGDYVKRLKSGDFYLEIGTKYGKSLASAIFQSPEGVQFFTCDIKDWQAETQPYFTISRKDFFEIEKLDTKAIFMLQDSVKIASQWENTGIKFSMIFVDGDHIYEGVKADIEGWLPHLKSGGFMLFHDYFAGVQLAVDELVKDSDKFKDFFIAMDKYDIHSSSIVGANKK